MIKFLGASFLLFFMSGVLACTTEIFVNKAITPVTLELIKKSLQFSQEESCSSVLMHIDTPGGSLPATRLIVKQILSSPVPFLCLVSPSGAQATSAGAIILQACHVSGALRETHLGASTPITMGKQLDKESDIRKKIINDTVSFVKTLTDLRGRNSKFGEEIITQAKSVTAQKAYQIKAIDFVGDHKKDFIKFAQNKKVKMKEGKLLPVRVGDTKTVPLGIRYSILTFFADPQILYLIFLGSLMLIYFELTHPGVMIPGVVGGVGLVISLIGLNAMSVVWGSVALIFLGLIFFILEMFMPSFGVLGVGGIVSFIIGSIYLFDPVKTGGYQLPLSLIVFVSLFVGILMLGAIYLAIQTIRLKKHITGMEELLGKEGEIKSILKNSQGQKGWLITHGENWKFSSNTSLKEGDLVKIVSYKYMTLKVEKVKEEL